MYTHNPLISLIIPTKNSARMLGKCLLSLGEQDYPNIEIIVVDNFSTDTTQDIARKYTGSVYEIGNERTTQKNYGISRAKGEYICFIDSDMILEKNVLSECAKKITSSEKIGGVCIPERSIGKGWFVRVRDFERSFYRGGEIESARFFRKSDVQAVGGFEEDLVFFEESLLPQKIEKRLSLSCHSSIDAYIHHDESGISLGSWLKKKYYYGKSISLYAWKVREVGISETGRSQMDIFHRYMVFLSSTRFYTRPLLALGVLGLKTLEFTAGGLGYLLSKLIKHEG